MSGMNCSAACDHPGKHTIGGPSPISQYATVMSPSTVIVP